MRGTGGVSPKHGPFDTRWPCARIESSRTRSAQLDAAQAAEALDWDAFSTRPLHERRRHDSEGRSAYAAYSDGREWRLKGHSEPRPLRLVPNETVSMEIETAPGVAGTRRLAAAVANMHQGGRHDAR
jgi:hypothetical protein